MVDASSACVPTASASGSAKARVLEVNQHRHEGERRPPAAHDGEREHRREEQPLRRAPVQRQERACVDAGQFASTVTPMKMPAEMAAMKPRISSASCTCFCPSRACLRCHAPAKASLHFMHNARVRGLKLPPKTHWTRSRSKRCSASTAAAPAVRVVALAARDRRLLHLRGHRLLAELADDLLPVVGRAAVGARDDVGLAGCTLHLWDLVVTGHVAQAGGPWARQTGASNRPSATPASRRARATSGPSQIGRGRRDGGEARGASHSPHRAGRRRAARGSARGARGRRCALRGRAVPGRLRHAEAAARAALLGALRDADAKTRRNAAMALGHASGEEVETALLAGVERAMRGPEMRRTRSRHRSARWGGAVGDAASRGRGVARRRARAHRGRAPP